MSGDPPFGGFGGFGGFDPEALRDAPLFRELQRVMAASSGPVNWELARQVGVATAAEAGDDPEPTDEDRRILEEAVRIAELQVTDATGLAPPSEVARVRAVRRAEWVSATIEELRSTLEPAAARLSDALTRAMQDQLPAEMAGAAGILGQLGPLLQGSQTGAVLGTLAQRVLAQYDLAVPRAVPSMMLFVVPTIASFERDWSLDPVEFRTHVALHEVTHRLELARPWARERFAELLGDYGRTLTIDVEGLRERFASLDPSDPEALQRSLGGDDALFGTVLDDEQRLKLARIQAFMAAAEGYADHVTHELGVRLLSTHGRIEEAMRRHREAELAEPVFERLLGIDMPRERYELGRVFCDRVAAETDERTLARMWDGPDALPSLPELEEPTLWLSRTV
jgi:putative hydrolase